MIRIVIPHRDALDKDINTAPYHRWEHLFVNILQKSLEVCSARGMTTCTCTELYVELQQESPEAVKRCINRIRKSKVSANEFIIEGIIIDNELQCMEMIYRRKIGRCEGGSMLNAKEMYGFRNSKYLWDRISVTHKEAQNALYEYKSENEQPQDRISLIRNRMMQHFRHTATISSVMMCRGSAFVLYRIECKDGLLTLEQCKEIVEMLDMPKGFVWAKLKRHYAQSFIFWPSAEENCFKGLQLFTFIDKKRISSLWNLLVKYIMSLPIWGEAEETLLNEHLSNPSVMICAI